MNGEVAMRTLENFQKIAVKKKPKNVTKEGWKFNRKLQRRVKLKIQEKVYA